METLKDHLKTIGAITGVMIGIGLAVYLLVTFGDVIILGAAALMGLYTVYSIYMGVLKEIRQSRKRKEHKDVQQAEE